VQATIILVHEASKSNWQPPGKELDKTLERMFMCAGNANGGVVLVMDLVDMLVETLVMHQPVAPVKHEIKTQVRDGYLPKVRES